MNMKYKITETSIIDDGINVGFECWAKDVDVIKSSVEIKPDTSVNDTFEYINDMSYNILASTILAKETSAKRKNEKKIRKDKCAVLKVAIDDDVGKEKPVKKPEKE